MRLCICHYFRIEIAIWIGVIIFYCCCLAPVSFSGSFLHTMDDFVACASIFCVLFTLVRHQNHFMPICVCVVHYVLIKWWARDLIHSRCQTWNEIPKSSEKWNIRKWWSKTLLILNQFVHCHNNLRGDCTFRFNIVLKSSFENLLARKIKTKKEEMNEQKGNRGRARHERMHEVSIRIDETTINRVEMLRTKRKFGRCSIGLTGTAVWL